MKVISDNVSLTHVNQSETHFFNVVKYGKIVWCYFDFVLDIAKVNVVIGYLPVGFRPKNSYIFALPCFEDNKTTNYQYLTFDSDNGSIGSYTHRINRSLNCRCFITS